MEQPKPIAEYSYEEAFQELESIVDQLEKAGSVTLDNSIVLYERGVELRKHCEKILADAKLRIEKVTGTTPEGEPVTESAESLAS